MANIHSSKRIKIFHLVGTPGIGGVQTYLLELSSFDCIHRIKRHLVCFYGTHGLLKEDFISKGWCIHLCQVFLIDRGWRPYRLWKKIRHWCALFFPIRLFFFLRKNRPTLSVLIFFSRKFSRISLEFRNHNPEK